MQKNNLIGDNESDVYAIWRSFALRISHEPENLKLHTQRLLFGLENNLSDYVSGALQDLFICLRQKGLPLRLRLFNLLSPIMDQTDRVYFQKWLADDSDRNLKCRRLLGSVFKSETCQAFDGAEESNSPENKQLGVSPVFKSQLDEARYNLECGQILKAQAMLENICLKHENDTKAIKDLQALYTHTRQKKGLESFTQRFADNGKSLTKTWSNLLETAKSW